MKKTLISFGVVVFIVQLVLTVFLFSGFSLDNIILARAHTHHYGNHYIGIEPTCTEPGAKEYWVCCECHKSFFSDDVEDIENGTWNETGSSGYDGIGGLTEDAFIPALGHDWINSFSQDGNYHIKDCSRCLDHQEHECVTSIIQPSGLRRGYTLHHCKECDDSFYEQFDFSQFNGVTFNTYNKHIIPYLFDSKIYTINASIRLPKTYSSRAGVVVGGCYSVSSGFNIEINTNGRPRIYIVNENVVTDITFDTDIRDDTVKTISITLESEKQLCLFVDGILKETKTISCIIPYIGKHFAIGGDFRNSNAQYFKGSIYALSIYKSIRTQNEIFNDIIFANENDPNCCVSYNLIDDSYFVVDESKEKRLEYASVSSIDELVYQCGIGTSVVEILNDIVVNQPIYVFGNVNLISKSPVTLLRDPFYDGDIFVVGSNSKGDNPLFSGLIPCFTIGSNDGLCSTITIDGNALNMNVKVKGSAIFAFNQSVINFYDGDSIINCFKEENRRTNEMKGLFTSPNRIGGAAVLLKGSTFNMSGGIIDNCSVNTSNVGGNSSSSDYMVSTLGGAVYVSGEFYMSGGLISNCSAYYGGAIYERGVIRIKQGEIRDNYAYDGGAIHSSGTTSSDLYIGLAESDSSNYTVSFVNNTASYRGGAITSSIQSPIVIKNAEFIKNSANKNSGGAIFTSGPLTIKNSKIDGCYAGYAGGAVYHYLSSTEYRTHYLSIEHTIISNNIAMNKGAGVCLGSSADDQGTIATISNCVFEGNYSKATITEQIDNSDPDNPIVSTTSNGGSGGALYSTGNSTLTVDECVFKNNKADNMGACLNSTDNSFVSISNSSFIDNWAKSYGGGLSLYGGTKASLTNLAFNNNSSDSNAGAVYLSGVSTTLCNVNFANNNGKNGGAVYITGNSELVITEANFSNNSSDGYGGAIYMKNATLTINEKAASSVVFDENTSTSGGGAIAVLGEGNIDIVGGLFQNNTAGTAGGAIYINCEGKHSITDATFTNNYSTSNGGAIWLYRNLDATIESCSFISNSGKNGGAIYSDSKNIIEINNSSFEDNSAFGLEQDENGNGGAIAIYGGNSTECIIDSSFFSNNSANVAGGAVYNKNSILLICGDSSFLKNTANSHGGAVAVVNSKNFEVIGNTIFDNNIAQKSTGGAVYLTKVTSEVVFNNTIFISNESKTYGGALYIHNSEATIRNCTLGTQKNGNITAGGGGAIYVSTYGILNSYDSTFIGNEAKNGGAILLNNGYSVNLVNTSFIANSSTANGGAIEINSDYNATLNVLVDNSTNVEAKSLFELNVAGSNGGAIYISDLVMANILDIEFSTNSSQLSGGAIFGNNANLTIANSVFLNNESLSNGGSISLNGGVGSISGTNFTMNSSSTTGGAIDILASEISIDNCSFYSNNSLGSGGAVKIGGNNSSEFGVLTISSTYFDDNSGKNGGAVFGDQYSYVYTNKNTVFSNNTASISGGAVFLNNRFMGGSFDNSLFEYNKSTDNGGAVCIKAFSDATISFCYVTFDNNSTPANGGALYIGSGCNVVFDNIIATNNNANYGGFAYITSSGTTVTLYNIQSAGNSAKKGNSGFIIVNNANSKIKTNESYIDYKDSSSWELESIIVGPGIIEIIE